MGDMLQSNSVLPKWSFSWLFPDYKILSVDSMLPERQKLAKFILDLGTQLTIPDHCIHTAIVYMHRFLMIHPLTRYHLIRLCQASIYLACKHKKVLCPLDYIYVCTTNVLKISTPPFTEEVVKFHQNDILKYEDILLSTLGFAFVIRHPHEMIGQIIQKIKGSNELKDIACYLATKSILLTPFCIKYSTDLIAYFCIQLAIEIKDFGKQTTDEINKLFAAKQLQNLIQEFYIIYGKSPDKYKTAFNEEESQFNKILDAKVKRASVSSALNYKNACLPSCDSDEQQSSDALSLSSTTEPPSPRTISLPSQGSVDLYRQTEAKTSSTSRTSRSSQQIVQSGIDLKSTQADAYTGTKRRCDSPNSNNETSKRLSSFPQQRTKR